jgi:carboxyl-terminal processing protease
VRWPVDDSLRWRIGTSHAADWAGTIAAMPHDAQPVARFRLSRWRTPTWPLQLALAWLRRSLAVSLLVLAGGCASVAPPVQDDAAGREALLQAVWQTLGDRHVDPPPPGWADAVARHRPAVLAAPPLSQDPEALWTALDGLAAEWRDAHTRVEGPRDIARQLRQEVVSLGFVLLPIAQQWVAFRVDPESPAHAQGLRDGMVLLDWNGEPPQAVWARLQQQPRTSSTPQATDAHSLRRWLDGAPGTWVHSRWQRADGSPLAVTAERQRRIRPPSWQLTRRDSGVAVLRWSRFDSALEGPLVRALGSLSADVPGLVLDLRGNGGGSVAMTQRLAAAMLPTPHAGALVGRKGEPGKPTRLAGRAVYTGPLVVLLDRYSASGSELLARTLQYLGRARVVGETSCGCLLVIMRYLPLAPDARLAVSERHIHWSTGRVEGVGVLPDVPVQRSLAGVQAGRDEVLEQAERLLLAP